MQAYETHTYEMQAHDMHAHEMHAHRMHAYETRAYCCAQQTGMHILVVEALLVAIYSTGDEQILIHKRKPCRSRTCLVRIAGSLSSWAIPAVVYEPANSNRDAAYSQHLMRCIPVRYTLMRCTPVRCMSMRYMPVRAAGL